MGKQPVGRLGFKTHVSFWNIYFLLWSWLWWWLLWEASPHHPGFVSHVPVHHPTASYCLILFLQFCARRGEMFAFSSVLEFPESGSKTFSKYALDWTLSSFLLGKGHYVLSLPLHLLCALFYLMAARPLEMLDPQAMMNSELVFSIPPYHSQHHIHWYCTVSCPMLLPPNSIPTIWEWSTMF